MYYDGTQDSRQKIEKPTGMKTAEEGEVKKK